MSKLDNRTCKLPVSGESVHLLSVLDRISGIQPVGVFELDGFPVTSEIDETLLIANIDVLR